MSVGEFAQVLCGSTKKNIPLDTEEGTPDKSYERTVLPATKGIHSMCLVLLPMSCHLHLTGVTDCWDQLEEWKRESRDVCINSGNIATFYYAASEDLTIKDSRKNLKGDIGFLGLNSMTEQEELALAVKKSQMTTGRSEVDENVGCLTV